MLGVRITMDNNTTEVTNRPSQDECEKLLTSKGFYESHGVWRHLDGRVAGTFSSCPQHHLFSRSIKPLKKSRSILDSLVGK